MSRNYLDQKSLKGFLDSIPNGRIFTVVFERKDGTLREMTCRRGVTKDLKGGESTIAHVKTLYGVYDMRAKGYRCFDLRKVVYVKGTSKGSKGFELRADDFDATEETIYKADGEEKATKPRFSK